MQLKRPSVLADACQVLAIGLLVFGCSGRRVDMDTSNPASSDAKAAPEAPKDPKDLKIDNLTSALSRAQSRIEELDAKVSALSDKVEATRLAVDNVSGNKPLKTEAVGSATAPASEADADSDDAAPAKKPGKGTKVSSTADARALLGMDGAISEFNKAMSLFKTGKFADSELAFNHFTEQYPEHILAGSAQFYAGESYFMMNEYKLALNEYGKVVSSFASSPRVASAMVRMAHCYEAIGNAGEASRTMALAHDLFEGNPSLDWPGAPKQRAAVGERLGEGKAQPATPPQASSKELNAGPMEPAEEAKHK